MDRGTRVADRFVIEGAVGSGASGRIHGAWDERDAAPVALKLVRIDGPQVEAHFEREVALHARLRLPGLVGYRTHGRTAEGDGWIALEWLDGEDLASRIARGPLSIGDALVLAMSAARALAGLHAQGVVHRDVKPANLFLRGGRVDEVVLLDLGSAGHVGDPDGVLLGTAGYLCPERITGGCAVDPRADVFALGCVLYEALTGSPAFPGDEAVLRLARALLAPLPSVGAALPGVDPRVDSLIAAMLAREPGLRLRDGAAASIALEAVAQPFGEIPTAPRVIEGTLSDEERRLCSVLLGVHGNPDSAALDRGGDTLRSDEVKAPAREATASHYGGRYLSLRAGAFVVVFPSQGGAATDHVARAARCALALRELDPDAPMALLTGPGSADDEALDDEADRALRASRSSLGQRTSGSPRPVVVDALTAGLVAGRFECRELGDNVFALTREWDATARASVAEIAPFVGRTREVDALLALAIEAFQRREARAALVLGAAGIGKSRLRAEVLVRLGAEGVTLHEARGDAMRTEVPLGLLGALLRGAAGVREGEALPVRRHKLRSALGQRLSEAERDEVTAFLGEIAGVNFPDERNVALRAARGDPRLMAEQLRRAFVAWLGAESAAGPQVISLDDLHHADLPSLRLLDHALEALPRRPWVLLGFGRAEIDERSPGLWGSRGALRLSLGALDARSAERLLRSAAGPLAPPARILAALEVAGGQPLLLEEIARAMAAGHEAAMAPTVLAMARSRLDALDVITRRVLRAASVYGTSFWRGGVRALAGEVSEDELDEALRALLAKGVVQPRGQRRFFDEDEYRFRHAVLREAAYGMLTEDDRALGHRVAGAWLARQGGHDPAEVAMHLDRGGDRTVAGYWWLRAARAASGRNDIDGSVALAERALALGLDGAAWADAQLLLAEANDARGQVAEVERCAVDAWRALPTRGAQWYRAAALATASASAAMRPERFREVEEALDEALRAQSPGAAIGELATVTVALLESGQYALVDALLERLDEAAGERALVDPALPARVQAAHAQRRLFASDVAGFRERSQAAAEAFAALGDRRQALVAQTSLGLASLLLGEAAAAVEALQGAAEAAVSYGYPRCEAAARRLLGEALAATGRWQEGVAEAEAAMDTARGCGDLLLATTAQVSRAAILCGAERWADARDDASYAVECLGPWPPLCARALGVLACAQLGEGAVSDALRSAERGMGMVSVLGAIGQGEAELREVFAEAHRAKDRDGSQRGAG